MNVELVNKTQKAILQASLGDGPNLIDGVLNPDKGVMVDVAGEGNLSATCHDGEEIVSSDVLAPADGDSIVVAADGVSLVAGGAAAAAKAVGDGVKGK